MNIPLGASKKIPCDLLRFNIRTGYSFTTSPFIQNRKLWILNLLNVSLPPGIALRRNTRTF